MFSLLKVNIKRCGYPEGFELLDVNFELREGEVLLVTGKSGSGKTTLLRAITGTIWAIGGFVEGKIVVGNKDINEWKPSELYKVIEYVPQEPWYAILGHTVYAEVCYALALNGVSCKDLDFSYLGMSKLINRLTYTLSAGESQRVLWLEAVRRGARLLILDEPLVYLDQEARVIVKKFVENTLERGLSVVVVDHDPFQWEFLDPKLLYLENGRVKYYGAWSREVLGKNTTLRVRRGGVKRGVFVKYENTWFKYPGGDYVVKGFTGTIERGSLTCFIGPNGAGKSTLLKLGAGVLKPSKGTVERHGYATYIPENPLLYFTAPTPLEELLLSAKGDENRVLDVAERLNLKHVLEKPLAKLSSGERRRIAIASAYLAGFEGYFIDEPTSGLDRESAIAVLETLTSLLEEGKSVVVATHDERVQNAADVTVQVKRE